MRIDKSTNLDQTVWGPDHDAPNDRSDTLVLSRLQRLLSWTVIRFLGDFPLFAGAYILLVATLVFVSGTQWLNANPVLTVLNYPVPIPATTRLLLLGSVFLAAGSTVFELWCPPRVKEFSRVKWVEELGRPGLLHSWEALRRPIRAGTAISLTAIGGILVGLVFLDRLIRAVVYVVLSFR